MYDYELSELINELAVHTSRSGKIYTADAMTIFCMMEAGRALAPGATEWGPKAHKKKTIYGALGTSHKIVSVGVTK
jgi:hypothetical protein